MRFQYMIEHKLVGISDIDTRRLTRILREKGSQGGCIVAGDQIDEAAALAAARGFPGLQGMDLAKQVTSQQPYDWHQGSWTLEGGLQDVSIDRPWRVVAYDFGVKRNILRMLADRGCQVHVVPAQTPAAEVLAMQPDGVFLSNGPGDPEPCDYAIDAIQEILAAAVPVFGICLGHQILALALGAQTTKMHHGHRGANPPVKDLETGKVQVTSPTPGFVVDKASLPKAVTMTHVSLFDGSLEGIKVEGAPVFAVQYHPEASAGPHDAEYLFGRFMAMMEEAK